MSNHKQPVVKPKVTPARQQYKPPSGTRPEEVNTDKDEEMARRMQEEMLKEQEQSDAEMARRLHEEEQSKTMPARHPVFGRGAMERPESATPLHRLFQTLYHMQARPMQLQDDDDDDDDVTPAMEPGSIHPPPSPVASEGSSSSLGGDAAPSAGGGNTNTATRSQPETASSNAGAGNSGGAAARRPQFRPRGAAASRSPERLRRGGLQRSPERAARGRAAGVGLPNNRRASTNTAGDSSAASAAGTANPLEGVRVNPARQRLPPPRGAGLGGGRRVIVTRFQPPAAPDDASPANVRPIADLERPGLGLQRENTLANLQPDEFDPDLMVLDLGEEEQSREDNFLNVMRDPFLLMLMLMGRRPQMMVPDNVDLNNYEELWDLAERLGEVRNRGMSKEDIDRLPKRKFHRTDKEVSCSVCLSEATMGEELALLPCKHEFHTKCIAEWIQRNATCPVCRQETNQRGS